MSVSNESHNKEKQSWSKTFQEIAGVFAGIVGFLVAATWYMGRKYLDGYTEALNVDISQLEVSLPEYLYYGAVSLFFFALIFTILTSFIVFIGIFAIKPIKTPFYSFLLLLVIGFIGITSDITRLSSLLLRSISLFLLSLSIILFISYFYQRIQREHPSLKANLFDIFIPETKDNLFVIPSMLISIFGIYYFLLLLFSGFVYSNGENAGRMLVVQRSKAVKLVSYDYLMLDGTKTISTTFGTETILQYNDLRLLLFNNDQYFLYNQVDANCKPVKVFVIKTEQLRDIQLSSAQPIEPNCQSGAPVPPPTVTVTGIRASPTMTVTTSTVPSPLPIAPISQPSATP